MRISHTDFSKGSVPAAVMKVALPMIIAEFVNLLYNMVDRIYIGHIPEEGSIALTGLGICFPIISLISAFARLFGFNGGAPLASMALGEKREEEARNVLFTSFTLAAITGLILTLVVLIFIRPILYAFGSSDQTYGYARDYLAIYALGSVPVLITLTLNAFINSQGFATIGMITVLIGAVINIILDPVLIFIFDMGKPVKIVDLARRMISLSGRTDVKIEFTGLRHGEKLYEELLNVKELTKPTYHEKIMIATVREYDYDEVKERIQHLIDISYTYDQMKIVAAMKDIVPEFVSKNSCFEVLDKK